MASASERRLIFLEPSEVLKIARAVGEARNLVALDIGTNHLKLSNNQGLLFRLSHGFTTEIRTSGTAHGTDVTFVCTKFGTGLNILEMRKQLKAFLAEFDKLASQWKVLGKSDDVSRMRSGGGGTPGSAGGGGTD